MDIIIPVSVIVPCYNCQATIMRAVESVSKQTRKPHELILVNDGSQDGTLRVLKKIQNEFGNDWIKIINFSQNKGPSCARNAGWDVAVCPYIAFLDADDSWHPEKLAIQYGYMSDNTEITLTGHACTLLKGNSTVLDRLPEKWNAKTISKLRFMLISHYFATPTVMLKKSIVCRFPEDIRFAEDRFLWLKIISTGNKAAYLDLPLTYLYKYQYGQGGLTKSLWKMERGELTGFFRLYELKLLNRGELYLSVIFSLAKFIRRGGITMFNKYEKQQTQN